MSIVTTLTKDSFKRLWESDDNGGGITMENVADCAIEWRITSRPRCMEMGRVLYLVLRAAETEDAEDYNPDIDVNRPK